MLLNQTTEKWLDAYIANPQAALLIDTRTDMPTGLGIAQHMHKLLVRTVSNPMVVLNFDDKKSIGIDDVRSIQKQLSLQANKTTDAVSRIIALPNAQKLTTEAQNALLKLLEELPERTLFLLLAAETRTLLDTIKSRCFVLPVLPLEKQRALAYGSKNGYSSEEINRAHLLSDGNSSLFEDILRGDNALFDDSVDQAKNFMSASVFDRQKLLKTILDKKNDSSLFLSSIRLVTKSAMRNSKDTNAKQRWKKSLLAVLEAEKLIGANVSPKLALLNLSVNL